jgi:hypothetical protein
MPRFTTLIADWNPDELRPGFARLGAEPAHWSLGDSIAVRQIDGSSGREMSFAARRFLTRDFSA